MRIDALSGFWRSVAEYVLNLGEGSASIQHNARLRVAKVVRRSMDANGFGVALDSAEDCLCGNAVVGAVLLRRTPATIVSNEEGQVRILSSTQVGSNGGQSRLVKENHPLFVPFA